MLIQQYQERWAIDFLKIKEVLEEKMQLSDIHIEHIGSTSVKGLASKSIIDIDLIYLPIDGFHEIKRCLENLGYFHDGNQGIEGREVFKRKSKRSNHPILDSITHHLYVCHVTESELAKYVGFNDLDSTIALAKHSFFKI